MSQDITDVTFDEWIYRLFDHPVEDPAWYWGQNVSWWHLTPADQVAYITRLFESAGTALAAFSDAQVDQGLRFLISHASEDMYVLLDEAVPWPDRERCINSFLAVFEQLFAVRCASELVRRHHGPDSNPLNSICYMWWDIFLFWGNPDEPHGSDINRAFLDVMQATLAIDSVACQESALHGLGHYPKRDPNAGSVKVIVDQFLAQNPNISPELREYALIAREGHVM